MLWQSHGDKTRCESRSKAACLANLGRDGVTATPAAVASCAKAKSALACPGYLAVDGVFEKTDHGVRFEAVPRKTGARVERELPDPAIHDDAALRGGDRPRDVRVQGDAR